MTRDAKRFLICVGSVFALLLIVSLISGLLGLGGPAVGESKTYEVEGQIKTLEVEISAADFRIVKGESFFVESNLKKLTFRQSGDRLVLNENRRGGKNYDGAFLTIYIPDGTVFTEIDITTGAGRFTADQLSAEKLDMEFGAGEVNIGELNATSEADIEGGAGQITIGGGSLNDLNFDMGVGELNITSLITGNSELNLGVGEVKITLIGSREEYTVEINKGIGSVRFDGEGLSTEKTMGNGQNGVEINGGIGSIEIDFK